MSEIDKDLYAQMEHSLSPHYERAKFLLNQSLIIFGVEVSITSKFSETVSVYQYDLFKFSALLFGLVIVANSLAIVVYYSGKSAAAWKKDYTHSVVLPKLIWFSRFVKIGLWTWVIAIIAGILSALIYINNLGM